MPEFELTRSWLYVQLQLVQPILGTIAANPETYDKYISSEDPDPDVAAVQRNSVPDPDEEEERGWTTFYADGGDGPEDGPFLHPHLVPYQIKGFLKESANCTKARASVKAARSKVEKHVYIMPNKIYFTDGEGDMIDWPDGVLSRPLRASTPQGPRVSIKSSHKINAGRILPFWCIVDREISKEVDPEYVHSVFRNGLFQGLGQWRNGGYGRFIVKQFREVDEPQRPFSVIDLMKEFDAGEDLESYTDAIRGGILEDVE